jgi:YHS domain-containing protein
MSFISRMMRFLLWVLVLCWGVALLRRAVAWLVRGALNPREEGAAPLGGSTESAEIASRRLVRDPVCGVHIAEDRAIALADGGAVVHFCSTACRDQYAGSAKKLAANG